MNKLNADLKILAKKFSYPNFIYLNLIQKILQILLLNLKLNRQKGVLDPINILDNFTF